MKRLAFNGGEVAPGMWLRSDMDSYGRSCRRLENWDVAATGGISRRHGFEFFAGPLGGEVRLVPYVYSDDDAYLVALQAGSVSVYGRAGDEEAVFATDGSWGYVHPGSVRWVQINSLLLVLSPDCAVMALRRDGDGEWSFERFGFKVPPWETVGLRDWEVTVSPRAGGGYTVVWPGDVPAGVGADGAREGDVLRVSRYTRREEARGSVAVDAEALPLFQNGLSAASHVFAGNSFYVRRAAEYEYYVCTKAWSKADDYTDGFESPGNYPDRFARADMVEDEDDFEVVTSVGAKGSLAKGAKLKYAVEMGDLFRCVREFVGSRDFAGSADPKDYPGHFVQGVPIGAALPCGGKWQFYCSGSWVGAYEVRRCYDTAELTGAWEHAGESVSPAEAPANNLVTGNEDEECWLRLFLTRVRVGTSGARDYWPNDACGNRLVVYPYRHDMQLVFHGGDEPWFEDGSAVGVGLAAPLVTDDWSWCAFRARCGYPCVGALHEGRLVLAGTGAQPQTLWLSRSDDLNNFRMGEGDDAGMLLEMQTGTQAAIRWLLSRSDALLVGTMDGEWVVRAGVNAGALTGANARVFNQGYNGSADVPAVAAADRVLYVERGGGRVYEFGYRVETDGYQSADLTVLADHVAAGEGGITGGAVMRKPCMKAVFTTGGGNLLLMTYNTMHNVNAWHRYVYGGGDGGVLDGRVESVAVLPHGSGADLVYASMRGEWHAAEAAVAAGLEVLLSIGPPRSGSLGVSINGTEYKSSSSGWQTIVADAIESGDPNVYARLTSGKVELTPLGSYEAGRLYCLDIEFKPTSPPWNFEWTPSAGEATAQGFVVALNDAGNWPNLQGELPFHAMLVGGKVVIEAVGMWHSGRVYQVQLGGNADPVQETGHIDFSGDKDYCVLRLTARVAGEAGNGIAVAGIGHSSFVNVPYPTLRGGADAREGYWERCVMVMDQEGDVYVDYQEDADGAALAAGYASVVETTFFSGPDYDDRRVKVGSLQVYLHGEVPDACDVAFSAGDGYRPTDGRALREGWNQVAPGANWRYGPYVGLRVTGDGPCTVLAMQAGSPLTV